MTSLIDPQPLEVLGDDLGGLLDVPPGVAPVGHQEGGVGAAVHLLLEKLVEGLVAVPGLLGLGQAGHVQQVVQARRPDGLIDRLAGMDDFYDLLRSHPLPNDQKLPQAGGGHIDHIPEVKNQLLDRIVVQRLGLLMEDRAGVGIDPPLNGNDALALVLLNMKYHGGPPL